jgi:hypothetical protein
MVAAIKEIGILSGKRVERRESGEPGEFEKLEQMTAAELVEYIKRLDAQLGVQLAGEPAGTA